MLCVLLAAAVPQSVFADAAGDAAALDQTVQQLKQEALDVGTATQRAEDALKYPPATRLTVDLSVIQPQVLIREITLSIDGAPPIRRKYSEAAARALTKSGGLDRLLRTNVAQGQHRLHAEFRAVFATAKADVPPVGGSIDQTFGKDTRPVVLELALDKGETATPALLLRSWNPQP
jgi:hypothetical protein